MQRRPAEDSDAYNHSAELNKSGGKLIERRRRHSAKHEAPPLFSICINLGDVPPEKINATITDRTVNISGEQEELIEEEDGMVRRNYQGFSNTFNVPPEVNLETLNLTICEKHILLVEADYIGGVCPLEEYAPKQCQTCPRRGRRQSLEKLSGPEIPILNMKSARTLRSLSDVSEETLYNTASNSPDHSHHSSRRHSKSNADISTSRRASQTDRSSKVPHPAERRGSKSHHEDIRRSSRDAERILKSTHNEGRRGSKPNIEMTEQNMKSIKEINARVLSPPPEIFTDTSDSSQLSSEVTTTTSNKNSMYTDQATSTDSLPTTEQSQPSFADNNRMSPVSTMESLACPRRAPLNRPAPASSTLKRRKHAPRTARKGKKFTFDSFPFCCCPRF